MIVKLAQCSEPGGEPDCATMRHAYYFYPTAEHKHRGHFGTLRGRVVIRVTDSSSLKL